jgi:hypothetical protein
LVKLTAGMETVVWIFTLFTPSQSVACLRLKETLKRSNRLQRFYQSAHLAAKD